VCSFMCLHGAVHRYKAVCVALGRLAGGGVEWVYLVQHRDGGGGLL
jgi:hypothetical protein